MKCPFRKSVTISHKSGNETTTTEWLDCYETECPAYNAHHRTCTKILEDNDLFAVNSALQTNKILK
jgi:hypothetical protein